tara:strand:- start:316 stop:801 length:486 start_codon:yes stop_codon:yes gene_type:complete
MADLTVTVKEEILLPNNNFQSTNNISIIPGVNQIVRRIDTIATTFSGSGIEILKFVDSEPQQVAGSFVKKDTKYIRITHISGSHPVTLYILQTDEESVLFELEPKKTFMLGNAEFNASQAGDYVDESYVDETYYSSFVNFDTIKAKASGSNAQLEYFVASS